MSSKKNTIEIAQYLKAEIYSNFLRYRYDHIDSGFSLRPQLVGVVIDSWIQDLDRFEEWHCSKNSETHKQAAFLVFWLSKVKPIAITNFHTHSRQITINEIFAFILAMRILGIDSGRISADFFGRFVYSLYYRNTSARQMFFTFEMLDRLNQVVPAGQRII